MRSYRKRVISNAALVRQLILVEGVLPMQSEAIAARLDECWSDRGWSDRTESRRDSTINSVLGGLVARGWLSRASCGGYVLTDAGLSMADEERRDVLNMANGYHYSRDTPD